jgi:hypothetical protein
VVTHNLFRILTFDSHGKNNGANGLAGASTVWAS